MKKFMTFFGTFVALFLGPVGLLFVSLRAFFVSLIVPTLMVLVVVLSGNPNGVVVHDGFLQTLQVASAFIILFGIPVMFFYNFICAIACLFIGLSAKPPKGQTVHFTPTSDTIVFDDTHKILTSKTGAKTINELYAAN